MNKQRYLFLDTETTGLDPDKNEVIEIAALIYEQGDLIAEPREIARYACKLRADAGEIDLAALAVNKRKLSEDVLTDSISADIQKEMIYGFADFLAEYVTDTTFVIGANIAFDIAFIKALFNKYGMVTRDLFSYRKHVDIQQIARYLFDSGVIDIPNYRLVTLALYFLGIDLKGHSAMKDVIATKDVYFKMRDVV